MHIDEPCGPAEQACKLASEHIEWLGLRLEQLICERKHMLEKIASIDASQADVLGRAWAELLFETQSDINATKAKIRRCKEFLADPVRALREMDITADTPTS
ncbi:MAG TPA: hypothetical protein VD994_08915 [Prosthecobacter sp.]|nr:hypothetical protein [Prosthecobacter sp.]